MTLEPMRLKNSLLVNLILALIIIGNIDKRMFVYGPAVLLALLSDCVGRAVNHPRVIAVPILQYKKILVLAMVLYIIQVLAA